MKAVFNGLCILNALIFARASEAVTPHDGAVVVMKKPADTCGYEGPQLLCGSSALIHAKVYVRKLYKANVRLANTNDHGELSIRLRPGRYEIGLSGRYAYGVMNRAFGIAACNRDTSTNGGFSCAEQSGCYPVSERPSSYPSHYREVDDHPLTSYTDAEAPLFVHVTKATRRITLRYHMRCI